MKRPPQPDLSGVVRLRSELIDDGYTDHQLAVQVRSGVLHRVRRGAYVDRSVWDALSAPDRHRLLCRAVLRTVHPLTALTHVSAVIELGVPVWGVSLDEVHTTRTDGVGARREAGVVHHVGVLAEEDVQVVNGVRVGPAARAAVEVMATETPEAALVVANGLLHQGQVDRDALLAAASAMKHWPHTLSVHRLTGMVDGRLESVAETRTYFMLRQHGVPRPEPQVGIVDEGGREFARVDFAWVEHGVFLEFDGRIKYELHRRDGETLEQFLLREKRREMKICQLTGWVCIRIGWSDLENPVRTCRRIGEILESRRR